MIAVTLGIILLKALAFVAPITRMPLLKRRKAIHDAKIAKAITDNSEFKEMVERVKLL